MLQQYFIALLLLAFSLTSAHAEWYRDNRGIMGTNIEVELWHSDARHAKACIEQVMNEMERINQAMSPYIKSSELYQVNLHAAERPVKISAELFDLIRKSIALSEQSGGAFDITFASVGYKYDYRARQKPSDEEIRANLERIDYRHLLLDEKARSIRFRKPGVRIDLGGIAKGHAVDNSIHILRKCGVSRAMVSAGGDSRIIGDRNGRPWMTGIV